MKHLWWHLMFLLYVKSLEKKATAESSLPMADRIRGPPDWLKEEASTLSQFQPNK